MYLFIQKKKIVLTFKQYCIFKVSYVFYVFFKFSKSFLRSMVQMRCTWWCQQFAKGFFSLTFLFQVNKKTFK